MRREMVEYDRKFPENRGFRRFLRTHYETLALKVFRFKMRRVPLGSPEWHRWQERLGRRSSVGLDASRRNHFYGISMADGCEGIHVLPGVSICYPGNVRIGSNVFINRGVYIVAPEVIKIGNNVLIGPYVVINSGSHYYSDSSRLIRDQGHKVAPITIGDDVWLGAHVVILPGVRLGRGCVVAAGAVVTKSVDENVIVGGVPATIVIGKREPSISRDSASAKD